MRARKSSVNRLEAWGPLSVLAARAGLPAAGPLMLPPGTWDVR